jgi:tetratricopeptide (TPR) repeat protein
MARFISESSVILPFIIVVDNAQHLDDSSANVLRTVARDDHSQRFLLFVAETAERVEILPPTIARELHLHELAEDDISRMSASLFGEGGVSSEIGSRIYQLYGGTPGIVVEALNAVSAIIPDDALRDSSNARKYIAELESKLPKNIDDFLLGRFHKLNRERQLIISILSCVQYPIKASLLYQVLPFHTLRSADHTRFLQLDGFIGVAENDRSVYIRMKRLKDAVYETIKEERNELHALIATTLEQDQTAPDFTRLQEMAYQFSRCNNYEKACTFSDRAGDEGLKFFALQRALQLYRDAIGSSKLTDQPERDLCLQVKYASALHKAGSYREAIDLGKELTESKRPTAEQQFNLLKVMGLSASRLGETEQAQKYLTLSLKLSTNEIEQLELRQELVGLQISAGHFKEAEIECREQLAYAKHLNVDRLVGAIYTDLGIAAFFQDHFDDAVLCFTDAMKTYEALNEKTQVINSINNIGNALSAKGDFTQAITYWERALKSSQEFGTPHQQAQIQNNLGIAYYNLKKYDKAKQFYADARAGYERTNSKIGYAFALTNLGEVMFAEGEYEGALNQWRDAKQLYASMDNPHGYSESCLHIANVLSRLGDLTSMSAQLDDADKMIEKNSLDTFRGKYHYLRGMCFLKQGKVESAEEAFRRACDLYRADNAKESLWLSSIRLAECFVQQRKHTAAASALFEVLNNSEAARLPHVIAEADYLIGTVALAEPSIIHEKPIVYFKHGIDAIAKEPVSETTWKLAFALAREYYERGQRERAREFLIKTRLILQFFLSHFKSLELKKQYLEVDQKERVFATIEAITKN